VLKVNKLEISWKCVSLWAAKCRWTTYLHLCCWFRKWTRHLR